MLFTNTNQAIYDENSAKEFLLQSGIDSSDIEEFCSLLCSDIVAEYKHAAEVYKTEYNASVGVEETYTSAMLEVQQIADEELSKQRISNARKVLESISRIIDNTL